MDIISHGLWGGIAFGRQNRRQFWQAFFFGIAPDLFSFGIFTAMTVLGLASGPDWSHGPPAANMIPQYVYSLYNVTHSLVVFAVVFLIVWAIAKKPLLTMLAWPLHILVDIPTHSTQFFPTPFLWPFFDHVRVNGIPWSHPIILIPDVVFLVVLYVWFFVIKRKRRNAEFRMKNVQ